MTRASRFLRRLEEEGTDLVRSLNRKAPLPVDILESDDEVLVLVDLPGCEKESIDLHFSPSVEGGEIRVEARREKPLEEGFRYVSETRTDSVEDEIDIDTDVEYDEARATYENGLLRIRLPKTEETEEDEDEDENQKKEGERVDID
ncbi:MAG: Hsp20/alpha crystallin family protein [Halobacteria archaeon]|nr:Hsp20/alpha crystallin family protein [Halobacteria archaeon]